LKKTKIVDEKWKGGDEGCMCGLGMEGIGAGNGKRRRIWVGVLVMKVEVDERKKMMMKGV